jgi:periplasmic protein TonB
VVAAPPKEEPKPEKKVEPASPKPQQVNEVKKPAKRLVQATTAARADRIAPEAPAQSSGASAAAAFASYRLQLVAHLQRFKRLPPGVEVRGTTLAQVTFTVSRGGGVSGVRLTKSTGSPAFDQEALAWIQRAQPMPSFPAEMREASSVFHAPLRWDVR